MRFRVTQRFDAPAGDVIDLYTSTELFEQLPEFGRIGRPEVLDRTERGATITIRLRYRFTAELPAAALAVIDPDRLTWVEETVTDRDARRSTVRLLPDHYASKLTAGATVTYHDLGDDARREVAGDLRVRVLLVGGQVERAIVAGLEEHLAEEAAAVTRILRG